MALNVRWSAALLLLLCCACARSCAVDCIIGYRACAKEQEDPDACHDALLRCLEDCMTQQDLAEKSNHPLLDGLGLLLVKRGSWSKRQSDGSDDDNLGHHLARYFAFQSNNPRHSLDQLAPDFHKDVKDSAEEQPISVELRGSWSKREPIDVEERGSWSKRDQPISIEERGSWSKPEPISVEVRGSWSKREPIELAERGSWSKREPMGKRGSWNKRNWAESQPIVYYKRGSWNKK